MAARLCLVDGIRDCMARQAIQGKVSELDDIISKQIAVDFDDTLAIEVLGEIVPTKGAKEAMSRLWRHGYIIVVHSARSWEAFQDRGEKTRWMAEWLHKNHIPYHKIHTGFGKPAAIAYVDDKAIKYENNWKEIVDWLIARKGVEFSHGKTGVKK